MGNSYDLSHLNSHLVTYCIPADPKKNWTALKCSVMVSYTDHCYTKEIERERIFDPIRYELSKYLPEIIQGLADRKCSFAKGKNFFIVDITPGVEYEIYFEIFKQPNSKKLALKVHSAYVRDPDKLVNRPKWHTIRFSVILYNLIHDKPIKNLQRQ